MAGNILLWALVVAHIGGRQTASVGAANLCVLAAASLTMIASGGVVRRRRGAEPSVWRSTLRRAWLAEGLAMMAGLAAVAGFIFAYDILERGAIIKLVILQAGGLPARYNGPLRARSRSGRYYKLYRSWSGAGLMLPILSFMPDVQAVSLALALREWIALLLLWTRSRGQRIGPSKQVLEHPPAPAEFATATANLSLRRFFYHVSRSLLSLLLGPVGNIMARTGRGFRLHGRLNAHNAMTRWLVRGIAVGACGVAFGIARFVPGPGALVASAGMLRVGCAAASAAAWIPFGSVRVVVNEDHDLID